MFPMDVSSERSQGLLHSPDRTFVIQGLSQDKNGKVADLDMKVHFIPEPIMW
jgi:hypothetical protein